MTTPRVEQDVAEILKKVRRIQIVANRTVNDLFAGQYKSVFRGRGMEFDEVREYQIGTSPPGPAPPSSSGFARSAS
jgi:uncharacterized protein (DUF58 family)